MDFGKAFDIGMSVIDGFRQNSDVSNDVTMLRNTLPKAWLLIKRSECWRIRHEPIDELLPQLKNAMYEAEIIIEDYEYEKSKSKAQRYTGELINNFKMWWNSFPDNVRKAQVNINHVYDELEQICNNLNIPTNPEQFRDDTRPETTESLPDFEVVGRKNELNFAIRLLRTPRSGPESRKISILPIVGMGGVGKTTLAQTIYNTVKSNFDLKIWVCVSDKLDKKGVTKQLLEGAHATADERSQSNLNNLQRTLQQKFKSKRVLLVLDDIWSKDGLDILGTMEEASEESVVILTSRSLEVVECTGTNMNSIGPIELEGLEKQVYWDLFKSCAGLEVDSENYHHLKDIAEEICKKLKGSPLAAKTLGGILRKNFDHGYWMNIRDSKMWELEQGEQDILPILQLSYQHLPSNLKKCFSFCSLFPKDHKFTENELTKFWIMQGFIPIKETLKHMEDLALNFFHDLVNRCFFQKAPGWFSHENKYVIHDLMHDVCELVTKDECHCLKDGKFEKISPDVQHLSVFGKNLRLKELRELCKFKKLRSLIVAYPYHCGIKAIDSWCNELMNIRTLSLAKCRIKELPKNVGKLKHLHYLDISGTAIKNLPDSFCSLYNLQYLDMRGCSDILCFPGSSDKLTRLQFFRPPVHLVHLLSRTPKLSNAIQNYNLIFPVKDDGKIENLKHLSGIRGFLEITHLEKIPSVQAAEEAQLHEHELLDLLRLNWYSKSYIPIPPYTINSIHEEVLNGLHPHPNLKELEIFNYHGENLSPIWMGENSPNLRRVLLYRCLIDPTVFNLPRSITELEFDSSYRLTNLQKCLQPNHLPNLKHLIIFYCLELNSLPVESFDRFPSLEKLNINYCPKLTCPREMVLPPSMKDLCLKKCGELENSIPSCLQNLTSLTHLHISDCRHLVSIPDEVMRDLKSLQRLSIFSCPALRSLGETQFPAPLKHLHISSCRRLELTGGQDYNGVPLSAPSTWAAALSSSHTSLSTPEMQLTETPSTGAAAQSASHTSPSRPEMQLTETPSTEVPSSSNVRKRKLLPESD